MQIKNLIGIGQCAEQPHPLNPPLHPRRFVSLTLNKTMERGTFPRPSPPLQLGWRGRAICGRVRGVRPFAALLLFALLIAACTLNTASPDTPRPVTATPTLTPDEVPLTVTWAVNGELFVWQSRDPFPRRVATGGAVGPVLSPDGAWAAYLRGPGGSRALWLVDTAGANERQLVDAAALIPGDSGRHIGQIDWSPDAQTLYFNTVTGSGINARPADDLWRVDRVGGVVERLLDDGTGGAITLSPDGTQIAFTAAGVYTQPGEPQSAPGTIAVFTPATYERRALLEFPAVATASQWPWYPDLRWLPDGSALRAAIPDPDLVYGEGQTALWALPVMAGEAVQIGAVDADFFGLPVFSADGAWITYLQRRADPAQTALTLMLARGDGTNATDYARGEVGSLSPAQWIAGGARFTFTSGAPGELYLGGPGASPVRFPAEGVPLHALAWANADTYVYVTVENGTVALWFGLLDVPVAPGRITTLPPGQSPAALDAVLP